MAYSVGQYELSADYWREVLRLNGNYDMAYVGIGRALLRQEKYKEAMEYFEFALDDINYSKAFQLYRKEWIEDNIIWIFTSFFLIITVPIVIGKVKKIRREVAEAE
jgi:tetratricopeptide (TPR) repeat protein